MTSLAETADRIAIGEDPLSAVRDFLDVTGYATAEEISILITERPEPTGDARIDALLAGLAEHISVTRKIACPPWVHEPIALVFDERRSTRDIDAVFEPKAVMERLTSNTSGHEGSGPQDRRRRGRLDAPRSTSEPRHR